MPWLGVEAKMISQASSQVAAAGGRPVVWYFAEEEVADRVRSVFQESGLKSITVIYLHWRE